MSGLSSTRRRTSGGLRHPPGGHKVGSTLWPHEGKRVQEFLPPLIEERWRTVFNPVRARKEPVKATTQIAFKDMRWLRTEMPVALLADAGGGVAMLQIGRAHV